MFRTPEGQARYFAAYDKALRLWPVPVESLEIPTRFGMVHLNACGPKEATPLFLIPGQAVSSTMWYPNVEALSRAYRVYAVDILGDMGKSVRTRLFTQPTDFADWMNDLFDGLQIEAAHVAGLSYGGFIALRFALSSPARVKKLILMSPASLLSIRPIFFARMMGMLLPGFILSARGKQKLMLGIYAEKMAPIIAQMLTTNDFQYNMYLPPTFTDDQLKQVSVPTLLMLGDREVIYDYKAAQRRAQKFISNIAVSIIPGAGHALNFDQPEIVNQHILEFLKKG
jgi:pimeloyl-ACP methyl ester carboxylesterase